MKKSSSTASKLRRLCVASAALCMAPVVSVAEGVSLAAGLTDFTTWTLFGSATALNQTPGNGFTFSSLILTQGAGGEAGAGFAPAPIALSFNQAFTFDFHWFIPVSQNLRGDGFTFVLAGAPGLGSAGSGLGYGGLSNSVAFAVDTFNFTGEPLSPSIQILQDGLVTPLASTETNLGDTIRDPNFQWFATVNYAPSGNDDETGTLTGTISHLNLGDFTVSANVDLSLLGDLVPGGHSVFFGFTAANGLAKDSQRIETAKPVPLPAAVWLLGSALAGAGIIGRRKV